MQNKPKTYQSSSKNQPGTDTQVYGQSTKQNPNNQTYILSRYRYVSLAAFLLACLVNSLPLQALTSINSLVQQKFKYSPIIITLCGLLGPIMHPLMATPFNWVLDKFGVRIGCIIGGILFILGSWTRCFMQVEDPTWCLIGSLLLAIGNLPVLSSPSAFALKWFPNDSAPKIISIAVLINFLSSGIGSSLGGILLPKEATEQRIRKYLIEVAIIGTIPFILLFIFYRQKPKNPPSRAAANKNVVQGAKQPYIQTIKKLLKNKSYLKVIVAMSFSYGMFISFASVLDQGLKALNYQNPNTFTSTIIIFAMLAGLLSSFLFTHVIRKTHQYKNIISLCLLGGFINFTLLLFSTCLKIQSLPMIGIMAASAGFFVIPLASLFASYAAELTFPVGQGSATGYLFAGAQTIGFIFGLIWVSVISKTTEKWRVYIMWFFHSFLLLMAFLINLRTKEHLNKTNYQQKVIQNLQYSQEIVNQGAQSLISQNGIRKNSR